MQSMTELINGDDSDSEESDVEKIEPLTEAEFISTTFFCISASSITLLCFIALSVRKIVSLVLQALYSSQFFQ